MKKTYCHLLSDLPCSYESKVEFKEEAALILFIKWKCRLDQRRLDILDRRYGLNGQRSHTCDEIGSIYNVRREWIQIILRKTLVRIAKQLEQDSSKPKTTYVRIYDRKSGFRSVPSLRK